MYKVYGIPNCDTVKKVIQFLKNKSIDFEFIDYKKTPPTTKILIHFKEQLLDWPVNKRGPTYRKIQSHFESANLDQQVEMLIKNSSALKRPIITNLNNDIVCVGFDLKNLERL